MKNKKDVNKIEVELECTRHRLALDKTPITLWCWTPNNDDNNSMSSVDACEYKSNASECKSSTSPIGSNGYPSTNSSNAFPKTPAISSNIPIQSSSLDVAKHQSNISAPTISNQSICSVSPNHGTGYPPLTLNAFPTIPPIPPIPIPTSQPLLSLPSLPTSQFPTQYTMNNTPYQPVVDYGDSNGNVYQPLIFDQNYDNNIPTIPSNYGGYHEANYIRNRFDPYHQTQRILPVIKSQQQQPQPAGMYDHPNQWEAWNKNLH